MPVKNVECQLAEMQIGRYVSGEPLSREAIAQLENHLAKCVSCSRVLGDRRNALKSMLTQGYAAVTTDIPTQAKENALMKALREKSTATPTPTAKPKAAQTTAAKTTPQAPKWSVRGMLGLNAPAADGKTSYAKPLIYSAALALVLFGMGFYSHGQNSVLGGSAESAFPPAPIPVPAPAPKTETPKTTTTPVATVPAATQTTTSTDKTPPQNTPAQTPPAGTISAAKVKSTEKSPVNLLQGSSTQETDSQIQPAAQDDSSDDNEDAPAIQPRHHIHHHRVIRPVIHQRVHTIHHSAPKKHASTGKIRIYDESGNPLGK
jgi:hypothetical protein